MIDTVTIFYPFRQHSADWPQGWSLNSYRRPLPGGGYKESFGIDDPKTGYHAYGNNGEVRYHRASLPRLLHGSNGKLIKSQSEIDAAINLLRAKAGQLGTRCMPDLHFTRVDLVLQFRVDPTCFILAHRNCRHARIHSDVVQYEQHSIALEGSELRISMYDKLHEICGLDGNVLRVELQIKGRMLKELLGDSDRVTNLDFTTCYQAYRQILLGFVPPPTPAASNIAEFLAIADREDWQSGGVPAFNIYTKNMSDRNILRLKQGMARCRPAVHNIDWAQLLPAGGPPPFVEIEPAS